MKTQAICLGLLGLTMTGMAGAQRSAIAAQTETPQPQAHNNVRRAIEWKQFNYACQGDAKLIVYLGDQMAKVLYGGKTYIMKQTMSADGNRYSDGKVVWWGKGNGGFLQEDSPDGNGKRIVQDCKLDEPLNSARVTGTVSYLQRVALPPNAVIQVQLLDASESPAKEIAKETINLGQRQVPVPFTITFDPRQIDPKHTYSVSAKISVDNELRFIADRSAPVLTQGKPSRVDVIVKPAAAPGGQ